MGFGSFCKTRSFIHSSGVGLKKATKKIKRWSKTQPLGGIKRVIKKQAGHKLLTTLVRISVKFADRTVGKPFALEEVHQVFV